VGSLRLYGTTLHYRNRNTKALLRDEAQRLPWCVGGDIDKYDRRGMVIANSNAKHRRFGHEPLREFVLCLKSLARGCLFLLCGFARAWCRGMMFLCLQCSREQQSNTKREDGSRSHRKFLRTTTFHYYAPKLPSLPTRTHCREFLSLWQNALIGSVLTIVVFCPRYSAPCAFTVMPKLRMAETGISLSFWTYKINSGSFDVPAVPMPMTAGSDINAETSFPKSAKF